MKDFFNLPSEIIEDLSVNDLVHIKGGITGPVAPNNGTGLCTGTNNDNGRCNGVNNSDGRCDGANNGNGRCGVTNSQLAVCGGVIIIKPPVIPPITID